MTQGLFRLAYSSPYLAMLQGMCQGQLWNLKKIERTETYLKMSTNQAILVLIQSIYFLVLKTPLRTVETMQNESNGLKNHSRPDFKLTNIRQLAKLRR